MAPGKPPAPSNHMGSWALEVSHVPSDALLLSCAVCLFTCHPVALRICLSAHPPPCAQIPPRSPHRSFAASPGDWQSAKSFMKLTKTNLWGEFPRRKSQFHPWIRNRMGVGIVTGCLLGLQGGMRNCCAVCPGVGGANRP